MTNLLVCFLLRIMPRAPVRGHEDLGHAKASLLAIRALSSHAAQSCLTPNCSRTSPRVACI
jgi:hypothetical protein